MPEPFERAPTHDRMRREQILHDIQAAKLPDGPGAPARFRLEHGYIADFVVKETARGSSLGAIAGGMGVCFTNAILNFCMNTRDPERAAIRFLENLADHVRREVHRCMHSPNMAREGFVTVDTETGAITDFDFVKDIGDAR